ncbi:MAG: hypothetical protein K2M46_09095 [Lachnospiraceae bacterium]|nr:hypothetical protein [Lachnospiraceae bacterium]
MPNLKKFRKNFSKTIFCLFFVILVFTISLFVASVCNSEDILVDGIFAIIIISIIWLLFIILGIIILTIFLVSYKHGKDELMNIPGFDVNRFNREIERGPKTQQLLISTDAICYVSGIEMIVIPLADVVWVYQDASAAGITINIAVWTREKKMYLIPVAIKKKNGTRDMLCGYLLRLIVRKRPSAIISYEDSYQQAVKDNFAWLVAKSDEQGTVDSAWLEQEYIRNNYYEKDFH